MLPCRNLLQVLPVVLLVLLVVISTLYRYCARRAYTTVDDRPWASAMHGFGMLSTDTLWWCADTL